MKKLILTGVFVLAAFAGYGVTAQADVKQDFITKFQSSLPEGWQFTYDDFTGNETGDTTEVHIKNLNIVSADKKSVFKQQGELVLVMTESRSNIALTGDLTFSNGFVLSAPVTIDIGIPKNILLEKRFTPEFWQSLSKLDLTVGKGTSKHLVDNAQIVANFDEFALKINKSKENPGLVEVIISAELKNLLFPAENKQVFKDHPDLNPFGLYGLDPTDQGKINATFKGLLKLPPYNEAVEIANSKEFPFDRLFNKGFGIDFSLVNTDDLQKNDNGLVINLQSDNIHFVWTGTTEVSELYTTKLREALVNTLVSMPKEQLNPMIENIQKFAVNKKDDFLKLIPNPHEWGQLKGSIDTTAKLGNKGELGKVDYNLDFSTGKSNYAILLNGFFENLPKESTFQSKTTITLKNYKQLIENSVKFYNQVAEAYKSVDQNSIMPIVSDETLQHYLEKLQELASSKSDDGKEITIIIDYTDPKHPKIGDKPLMEALMAPKK